MADAALVQTSALARTVIVERCVRQVIFNFSFSSKLLDHAIKDLLILELVILI